MVKQPGVGVPFTERRDSFELYRIPYYEEQQGVAPAGAIISNIEDMSHWLIALMNNGQYNGKQVLPPKALAATMEPANRSAERCRPHAGLVGSAEPGLRHGPMDGFVSRPPDRFSRRRLARLSLADFVHAE